MKEPKSSERRRAERSSCVLVVRYSVEASEDAWRPASVQDLTVEGCRLRVDQPLAQGTPLRLRFEALLHDGIASATIETRSRVMWCRPSAPGSSELGVRFDEAPAGLSEILRALGPR